MSNHHRKPKSRGGSWEKRNISKVPPKKHKAWHILFGNMLPNEICVVLNNIWVDPDYKIIYSHKSNRWHYRHR